MGFEDPDKPSSLERIIEACGGEAIDYPAKIKCCGFPIIQAREDTALAELRVPDNTVTVTRLPGGASSGAVVASAALRFLPHMAAILARPLRRTAWAIIF
jgi:hypothetical protein